MNTSTPQLAPRASRGPATQTRLGRRTRGFTLIELLAVLAIISILVGAGAPAMTATIRSVQLSSASNDLLGGLLMARSEAIKRNGRVVICKSPDGLACAATGGWEQGWLVFQDTNNDGLHQAVEPVIQRGQALATGLRVTGNLTVARYVSYSATGATKLVGGGFQAGTITVCRQSPESGEARQIIVSAGGRPRVQKVVVEACA